MVAGFICFLSSGGGRGGSDSGCGGGGGGIGVVASGARCCRYFLNCFSGCRKDTSECICI